LPMKSVKDSLRSDVPPRGVEITEREEITSKQRIAFL